MVELDREHLLALVQTDAASARSSCGRSSCAASNSSRVGLGDVVLIGSAHCAGTLRVKEFLTRNGHPYVYIDLDRDDEQPGAAQSISRNGGGCACLDLPRR